MTYAEKLKDTKWQKKRLLILERDSFTCQSCFTDSETLHVHHLKYHKGKEPWEIEDCYLTTLCEDCHSIEHDNFKNRIEELTEFLKSKGFISFHASVLINALKDMPFQFGAYEPNADILRQSFEPEIWESLTDRFWKVVKNWEGNPNG